MAKQTINIGASPNDGTGTPLRTAFDYTNQNFTELYTATGPSGNNIVVPGNATISGDLTVDTSTLKVDSANDRVGIKTATPRAGFALDVLGNVALGNSTTTTSNRLKLDCSGTAGNVAVMSFAAAGTTKAFYGLSGGFLGDTSTDAIVATDAAGAAIRFYVSDTGTEAMRLNTTGLGIGGSPASKLYVYGSNVSAIGQLRVDCPAAGTAQQTFAINGTYQGQLFTDGTKFVIGTPNATPIVFRTNLTEALTIDASQNVGIGVAPSAYGTGIKGLDLGSWAAVAQIGGSSFLGFNAYASTTSQFNYKNTGAIACGYQQGTSGHQWLNAPSNAGAAGANATFTTAMALDASGRLFVGKTSSSAANTGCELQPGTGGNAASVFTADANSVSIMNRLTSDGIIVDLRRQTLSVGNISVTTTGATFNSTSDYRLKEAVQPLAGGLARVNALKPSIYKWKSNGSNGEGFLAHELAEVVPFAVTGEKDAVNEDGSIKSQGIDMSRVVPILVAAIQELTARVQTLEAK